MIKIRKGKQGEIGRALNVRVGEGALFTPGRFLTFSHRALATPPGKVKTVQDNKFVPSSCSGAHERKRVEENRLKIVSTCQPVIELPGL